MTYDGLFVDLDGVVYRSDRPVEHAIDALNRYEGQILYVTNNASRTPDTVAAQLQGLGLAASTSDVVTSAQAAAAHLAELVPIGSPILVVGGEGLVEAVTEVGFRVVHRAEEADAVVQGFAPAATWKDLAEASYAVARAIPWVASNTDMSVPTSRGIAPGTGTYVAAVTAATGISPVVTGKPHRPIMDLARSRSHSRTPLVIGDRLDTDIAAANAAGMDSMLVLTGVSTWQELVTAPPEHLPTSVAPDLRVLSGYVDDFTAQLDDLLSRRRAGQDVDEQVVRLHQLSKS